MVSVKNVKITLQLLKKLLFLQEHLHQKNLGKMFLSSIKLHNIKLYKQNINDNDFPLSNKVSTELILSNLIGRLIVVANHM